MSRATHRIVRLVFEMGLPRRECVTVVQNRVSAFAAGEIHTVLTESLSPLSGDQDLAIFYRVELDLGTISLQRLEEDLKAGLIRCLREWALRAAPQHRQVVHKQIRDSKAQSNDNSLFDTPMLSAPARDLSLLPEGGLNAAVASAVRGSGDWSQLMAAVQDNHAFRGRLATEVAPELLRQLLQALVPAHGSSMTEFAAMVISLHDRTPLISVDRQAFRRALWACILTEVARYQPASFSLRSFLSSVLGLLAARHSLQYSILTAKIAEGLQHLSRGTSNSITIANILLELNQSSATGPVSVPPVPQREGASQARSSSRMLDLARFLEWGVLPWSALRASGQDAESEMRYWMAALPDEVSKLVRRLGEMQSIRKRIAGQFSEDTVYRLIGELDPVNATWMILCTKQLRRMHAQKPLLPLQNKAFAQLLSELTLEYLAERHWHALNAESFLRFLLQRLAVKQQVSYELLLADLALRRSPEPQRGRAARESGSQSLLSSTIVTLLENDVLGIHGHLPHAPRFIVQPAFQHLFSDIDVLAYWLRWRKLPSWSLALAPEKMAQHMVPLLRALPSEVRNDASRVVQAASPSIITKSSDSGPAADASTIAIQIERWLLYGLWPSSVMVPQSTALVQWLEDQDDSAWLKALQGCGAQDQVVQRMIRHLTPASLQRMISLLSSPAADVVCEYHRALLAVGPQIAGSFSPPWQEQASHHTLLHLLSSTSSTARPGVYATELANSTMEALSLRCQVSYERLLLLLQRESQGKQALLDVFRNLEAAISNPSAKTGSASFESLNSSAVADRFNFILHYLKCASLPEDAPAMSFRALQQLAGKCSDDEITNIARTSLPWLAQDSDIACRIAALFQARSFARFAAVVLPQINFVEQIERTLTLLAPKLSLQSAALLVSGRTLLLQHAADSEGSSASAVLFGWISRLSEHTGMPRLQFLNELTQAAGHTGGLAEALAELRHETRFSQPGPLPPANETGVDRDKNEDHLRGQLDAFGYLLKTGNIPWWSDGFVTPASSQWFKPLLEGAPGPLLQTLRSAAAAPQAIDRLILYVPAPDLAAVIKKASPEHGGLIVLYIEVGSALSDDTSLSAAQRSRTRGLHWRETLLALLEGSSPSRVSTEFLRVVTGRVAQKLGLTTDHYLQSLTHATRRLAHSGSGAATLAETILKLQKPSAPPSASHAFGPQADANDTGKTLSLVVNNTLETKTLEAAATEEQVRPAAEPDFPDETTQIGQLDYLLRYGMLPASLAGTNVSQFMDSLAQAMSTEPEQYRLPLQKAAGREMERKRIARMFPPHTLRNLWPLLLPASHTQAVFCLEEILGAAVSCSAGVSSERLRQTCIEVLLQMASSSRRHRWDSAIYLRHVTQRLVEEHSLSAAKIVECLRERLERQPKEVKEKLSLILDRLERETAPFLIRPRLNKQSAAEGHPAPQSQKASTPLPANEPFYIGNAGAIILWPFLGRYFQTLGLLENNAFRGEPERSRAIHLLQYLATGTLEAPEHELLLNKILCGAQPEQSLDPVTALTEAEEALSVQLLHGVIGNWEKLGKTSIDGLRQSFLVREGRLLRKDSDDSWSLTVSAKSYDMLLDSLPWRLSMVRLPWMKILLHVKWR